MVFVSFEKKISTSSEIQKQPEAEQSEHRACIQFLCAYTDEIFQGYNSQRLNIPRWIKIINYRYDS